MLSHLSRCQFVHPSVQAIATGASKKENGNRVVRMSQNQRLARQAVQTVVQPLPSLPQLPGGLADPRMTLNIPHAAHVPAVPAPSQAVMWDPSGQQEFAEDLCKLFIACNIAWNSANNPQLLLFFSKYLPAAKIPDRRVLSGRVLDTLVGQIETEMKGQVSGKLGMGQCDGWKTGAQASIVTTSVTVEAKVRN